MSCGRCGKHPGKIRYTEVVEGVTRRMMICPECADEMGFGPDEDPSGSAGAPAPAGAPEVAETTEPSGPVVFGAAGVAAGEELKELRCPGCGIRGADLRHASLLNCPRCYETFGRWLDPILERLHGGDRHEGRLPESGPDGEGCGEDSP